MSQKILIAISLLLAFITQHVSSQTNTSFEQLVVFTDGKRPILKAEDIQQLKHLAQELQVVFKLVDINEGAPKEVLYTPSIVYQNHRNRSFFYGRYKNIGRLKNFIRTSRMVHQQESENIKKDILVWKQGRAIVTTPIKVTPLKGSIPANWDNEAFQQDCKKAIIAGMQQFKLQAEINQTRTTRSFYLDIHPYLSQDGMLYLSGEIYSQFNCVKAVVSHLETPWHSGKWDHRQQLLEELGKTIEMAVLQEIQSSNIGDAFTGIPPEIEHKSWEELGFAFMQKQETQKMTNEQVIPIPSQWTVAPTKDSSEAIIIFRFLAPLDNYVGEVKALNGNLTLGNDLRLSTATGSFDVAIEDVTMGDEGLDDAVRNKMLKMSNFPKASLQFEKVLGGETPLEFAKAQDIIVKAAFKMIGLTIPVEIPARMEPVLNSDGELRLQVNASFELPLFEKFQIEGPDGPSPAKDILQFYLKFYLKPVKK